MLPCQVEITGIAVEITGIAGALQIYGCGTALFLADDSDGRLVLLRVHNCLYGQGQFNLLSVSQMCQMEGNSVDFTLTSPALVIRSAGGRKRSIRLPLVLEDGLFALSVTPFQVDDPRYQTLPKLDVTPRGVFRLSDAASTYRWTPKVLASASPTARILVAPSGDYDCNLQSFCGNFLAPPSIAHARRQYDPNSGSDMVELTTRFLGLGEDRLKRTITLNNGLSSPASKATSRSSAVRPFFPHGRWAEGKTPRVSKGKIGDLHHASVGEVVFTDTFESGDAKHRYGQAYFDLVSHWGDVFPLRSRTQVGMSFVDFCCRNWIPVYLVRDNIGENIGTSLLEECRKRNVKSVYICPRHPQQNYAEGYLGRVTAMASFAMVFAGAPLFMWVYAIRTAVFISNISASYFSVQNLWSTPYEVVHNEPFPDASIVVPFGCAVLVLRDSNDRPKFVNRCTMMIFVHYSDDHPLFTYAVYSPRTKRVLHRQDVIFLTSVFPMRAARTASGMTPDGEGLSVFRSPPSMLNGCPDNLSFGSWSPGDAFPLYDDDVTGFTFSAPPGSYVEAPEQLDGLPVTNPGHPSFPVSTVLVPIRAAPTVAPVASSPRWWRIPQRLFLGDQPVQRRAPVILMGEFTALCGRGGSTNRLFLVPRRFSWHNLSTWVCPILLLVSRVLHPLFRLWSLVVPRHRLFRSLEVRLCWQLGRLWSLRIKFRGPFDSQVSDQRDALQFVCFFPVVNCRTKILWLPRR
jgi:hypothetical protein